MGKETIPASVLDLLTLKDVKDLTADTRKVKKGSLFFLMPKAEKKFITYFENSKDALAFVHSCIEHKKKGVYVSNVEDIYFESLKFFYKESVEDLKIYGFTGTNGKTTTAFMLQTMLESYGVPTGLYGTVKNAFKDNLLETGLTSPVAEDFYRFNHTNYKKGMRAVVCEVSSHALDQKRLGMGFLDCAGFTSFSQDHLDYHKTMKDYLHAKMKINTEALKEKGAFVISKEVKALCDWPQDAVLIGEDFKFKILERTSLGTKLEFSYGGKTLSGVLPLFGDYNASNFVMALVMLCKHFGEAFFPDERVFEEFKQIPGRMERIDLGGGSAAFIDYSHTPDSLEKALETLNDFAQEEQQVICVFGCGGDRDKGKRALMGAVSEKLADQSFITSDNPRSEDPFDIIKDIQKGFRSNEYTVEENRAVAILKALKVSKNKPSFILVAGKGHETTQEVKGVKKHFSDLEEVLKFKLN